MNRVEMIAALKLSEDRIRCVRQGLEELERHDYFERLRVAEVLAGLHHEGDSL